MNGITLSAIIEGLRTTKDGGWVISLAVPQSELQAIMQLSEFVQTTNMAVAFIQEPNDAMPKWE